jgi:hypothetical protein
MKNPAPRTEGLAIVEKYDQTANYLYPIVQNIPRRHGVFRDCLLDALFKVPGLMYRASKSNQVSRIREVDAALAELRWLLRFAVSPSRKLVAKRQHEVSSVHLAEVGRMVGSWERNRS